LVDLLDEKVLAEKTPILGICLGMHVITKKSEEGIMPGLGWLDAETVRFRFEGNTQLKIPHMGWNNIEVKQDTQLFRDMYPEPRFYFVHSYYVKCMDERNVLATTRHGLDFASSVVKENIYGVQFHPEKSHKFGKKVLQNFVEMK
jgi:glutamine amidotransferase